MGLLNLQSVSFFVFRVPGMEDLIELTPRVGK